MSIQAVYDKLQGVEPVVAAELVPYPVREGQAILAVIAAIPPEMLLPAGQSAVPTFGEPKRAGKPGRRLGSTAAAARPANRLVPAVRAALPTVVPVEPARGE